ncbi:MAG: hypothetical protein KKA79_02800 [Nanoarchaeota archaeon]|nr:hypothetical protein [Nanoarchaeota archaeon]MCG2718837.1 hypothetical protein [Nanoarchaeota archaeon]
MAMRGSIDAGPDCDCKKKEDDKTVPSLKDLGPEEMKELEQLVKDYKHFLDRAQTPRQTVDYVENVARKEGFQDEQIFTNDNRSNIILVKYGTENIEDGLRILGAHVDSPCLHIKVNPIKEGPLGVRLDTQYYGGIVKHQWFDQQVKIIGHVVKNGKEKPISLNGVIIDIAPHINKNAGTKVDDAFKGEDLDILTGYPTKEALLKRLRIKEEDFRRAELYAVPVEKTKVLKDLIIGYGHDDKVCMYTQLRALLNSDPKHTTIVYGVDREEIGSTGLTGAIGAFFEQTLDQIVQNETRMGPLDITQPYERLILKNSMMLSADVDIAATFRNKAMVDETNTKAGHGLCISSYCGSGGKYMGNQVTAKFMDQLITIFEENKAVYQVSGMPSKVDSGGGGTIAKYFAERGIPTADAGVPVAGMHSKTETIHRGDLYQTMKCFEAFIKS